MWTVLKIQVQKRLREIKNADDLRGVILDIWTGLGYGYGGFDASPINKEFLGDDSYF